MSKLNCECCTTQMKSDFSNNVWCPNEDCLLHEKCYSFDFYYGRAVAIANGDKPQQKERMAQGWANSPTSNGLHLEPQDYIRPELMVNKIVTFTTPDGNFQRGVITDIKDQHVVVDGWRMMPKHHVEVIS